MEFFTIGVYNTTETLFFEKLIQNKIDTVCDIRQRRGVRGAKYSFVNSIRLQKRLRELGIDYAYVRELAPTAEIREFQKSSDRKNRELKRDRMTLADDFVKAYKERVLERFDFDAFFDLISTAGSGRIALFCVEDAAEACHRSIVADKLRNDLNFAVTDI